MGHLRLKFKAKIAVSLLDTKRRCYEGYTAPRVKLSTVEKEIRKLEVLLRVKLVGKRKRVKRIRLVIGGDHGQGALRLGFRVLIDTESDEGTVRQFTLPPRTGGNGQHDRTGKHPIIAAKLGLDESMKNIVKNALPCPPMRSREGWPGLKQNIASSDQTIFGFEAYSSKCCVLAAR
eukprot:scaffold5379_cov151-Skeletonema_dohrnii-CCMP3373.AAC.3